MSVSVNILLDKAHEPNDELVKKALGAAWPFFHELRGATEVWEQDWRHHGKKYGWKLKVHAEGKNLLEITVADGWFLVAMAIRETERRQLMADPTAGLAGATDSTSAEGYGVKIEVRDRASCDRAKKLAAFIMSRRERD